MKNAARQAISPGLRQSFQDRFFSSAPFFSSMIPTEKRRRGKETVLEGLSKAGADRLYRSIFHILVSTGAAGGNLDACRILRQRMYAFVYDRDRNLSGGNEAQRNDKEQKTAYIYSTPVHCISHDTGSYPEAGTARFSHTGYGLAYVGASLTTFSCNALRT